MHRDLHLQFTTMLIVCGLCWYIGKPFVAIFVAATLITSEFVLHCIVRRKGIFHDLPTDRATGLVLAMFSVNVVLYLLPSLFLAQNPSLAMKITAIMWVIGVQVYLSNIWVRVPVFLTALQVPALIMMTITLFLVSRSTPEPSPVSEWGAAFGFMLIFTFNTFDTLRKHMMSENELAVAQTEAASRLAQLEESNRLDPLTGLLNRSAFDRALQVMLEDRKMTGSEITVFLVDLDSFKPINDTYSHEAGDEVLLQTAHRLSSFVAQSGIVGRLGGDEFICAVHDIAGQDEGIALSAELTRAISRPIHWKTRRLKIAASIGIAMTGDSQSSPEATVPALCSAADQAMFAAKSSPNRMPVFYQSHLFAPRMSPEDKQILIDSISEKTLKPYYQPKVHLPTGQIIGFEALARWEHPVLGVRAPSEFVEQINELGLQGDFMMSMAEQVVADITALLDRGLDPGQLSLNVPEVALATHTGRKDLQTLVENNPKAAQHLTFEITEDVFIARAAETIQASIAKFRALGVRVSLDDFGTGFASFHHLQQLEFDELKIDTSFVAGLGHDSTAEVLVRGFLNIASGLGVSVVAEGVETEAQARDLINMGCVAAQGFLYSEAVPFLLAIDLLTKQQAA